MIPPLWVWCSLLVCNPPIYKAETPILWPLDVKSWLIWKDSDAGKDWGHEEKGTTGCDGWMASPTQWTWVWVDPRSWWWTGRPGVLRCIGSQRVGHDWATELNWSTQNFPLVAFDLYVTALSTRTLTFKLNLHSQDSYQEKYRNIIHNSKHEIKVLLIKTEPILWNCNSLNRSLYLLRAFFVLCSVLRDLYTEC